MKFEAWYYTQSTYTHLLVPHRHSSYVVTDNRPLSAATQVFVEQMESVNGTGQKSLVRIPSRPNA